MIIERPPLIYRALYPGAMWRGARRDREGRPTVYLTFDDGPVPEVTPAILDILDSRGVKATFFVVADNARRRPGLLDEIIRRGHRVGNHTFHHLRGLETPTREYLDDVEKANAIVASDLFRAPHGLMRLSQYRALSRRFRVVFHDLVTRDYSRRLTPADVLANVSRYARPGSIIVFHDSVKARQNVLGSLAESIDLLKERGFTFSLLDQ